MVYKITCRFKYENYFIIDKDKRSRRQARGDANDERAHIMQRRTC